MITYQNKNINTINQNTYNKVIESIDLCNLQCSCGQYGCLTKHGYYTRAVKLPTGKIKLRVLRVICSHCHKTHAILLQSIVPYSSILLNDQLAIIHHSVTNQNFNDIKNLNPEIDDSNIAYIITQYQNYWKEVLISFNLSIHHLDELLISCFKLFKRSFMQIKNTIHLLFTPPHTT